MSVCESAAIIGLGLVGGSLARDLAARGVRVRGYDANADHLARALRDGAVHEPLDASLAGVRGAQVVVIAVPVNAALVVLRQLAPYVSDASLVTDVGSTKAAIVSAAAALGIGARFVGAHPMAGGHRSGWDASTANLFTGARVFLCPAAETTSDALQHARVFWTELGAEPSCVDAGEHDRALAWASHLPHVVSAATALALSSAAIGRHDLGPGGRDVTRLAGSSPEIWTAIARENADALDDALAAAEQEIARFRRALADGDEQAIHARFTAARDWFER